MKINLPIKAKKIISFFEKRGFECYVVGGFIRDSLIEGRKVDKTSLDFATNATPDEMLKILPEGKYENRFGTVIFPLKYIAEKIGLIKKDFNEKDIFEITTYRCENNYKDHRHPEKVSWGKSITEDLERRDFTINAMAFDGNVLVDPFNGTKDIKEKIIKAVGNPLVRFKEDALRMLRAVRFACTLDFLIEEKTLFALDQSSQLLINISFERIRDEFLKILGSEKPDKGILLLRKVGLLKEFLPELNITFGVSQKSPKRHHIYDVGTHLVKTLAACKPTDPIVRLACLLHDIGKGKVRDVNKEGIVTFYNHEIIGTEIAYEIGMRLRLSKADLHRLTKLVRFHQFSVTEKQTDKAIRRFIRQVGKENLNDMLSLRTADRIGSGARATSWRTDLFKEKLIEVQKKPFTVSDLKIGGLEVMEIFKIKPGPKVGQVLNTVFEEVVNNNLENNKKDLLKYLKELKKKS
jgi:putative nucleotidyltransferase with HDIG domain